jgi:hypothetical protein
VKPSRLTLAAMLVATACLLAAGPAHARSRDVLGGGGRASLDSASQEATSGDFVGSSADNLLPSAPVAEGRVLVRTKGSASRRTLADLAERVDASVSGIGRVTHDRFVWRTPAGRSDAEFARELERTGKVVYAAPDRIRHVVYTPPSYSAPDDPFFTDGTTGRRWADAAKTKLIGLYVAEGNWWLRDIRMPDAWQIGYTGADIVGKYPLRESGSAITVAVLDSGLYSSHAETGSNILVGRDFFDHEDANHNLVWDNDVTPVNPDTEMSTPSSRELRHLIAAHGTCVAGEVAAATSNAAGTTGLGYDTQVYVYKVMGRFRDGSYGIDDGAVIDAVLYATDRGAKVINMSFGGYGKDTRSDGTDPLADVIDYARSHGVVVVAAKGNDGRSAPFYPADYPGVVSVGAVDKNASGASVPASFSNYYRTSNDIMAPGSFIWGLSEPGFVYSKYGSMPAGYTIWDGTSMASPIVAGSIAWLWRAAPALSASEITGLVLGSATRHGAVSHYPYGWRELDVLSAYRTLQAQYPLLQRPGLVSGTVASLGSVVVGWQTTQTPVRGVTYDVWIDAERVATSTADGSGRFALAEGEHALRAEEHSAYNWDDGTASATASLQVVAPASGSSAWDPANVTGSASAVADPPYHGAVAIEATLRDASSTPLSGAAVRVESSTDWVHWSASSAEVAEQPFGVYRFVVAPESRTYYRLSFEGTSSVGGSASSGVMVVPHVALSKPSSRSRQSHTRRLAVSGTLRPRHGTSSRLVSLRIYRWNGHRWKAYSGAWTRVIARGSYSTYSAKLKLRKGSYRIYARAKADSGHAATTSSYKLVHIN